MPLAARPVEGIAVKVLEGKPVIQPVQDSTPDGQPMEGTIYLEHPALGCPWTVDSEKGCHVQKHSSNQCSERGRSCDQKRLICQSPIMNRHVLNCRRPVIDIVHNADVNTDINTDRPDNSAPRNISDVNLLKYNVQDTQEGRPMEGMTKSRQEDLSGFELAVAGANKVQLPTSYSLERSESIISESQSYLKNTKETKFSYDTGLSSRELEDAIRREVLRNRLVGQVNMTDADISLDQLRSEGLRRWNMDMDIEYQYETFSGLPVYYGGDRYDSDDTEEFIPNAPDGMEYMTCTQCRPDGGDNRSANTVNMTPMCRTMSKGARREADESSDTSRTDMAELDDTDCQLETDVWDDMYCPVWISGLCMVVSSSQGSQALSSNRDVACMGDFVDEDFNDTGFDSDVGSRMEFEWNTQNDAYAWESEKFPPDSVTAFPVRSAKEVVCYRDDNKSPEEGVCFTGIRSVNCATRYRVKLIGSTRVYTGAT